MRTIKIKLQIDGVDMVTSFTEEEYNLIKEKVGYISGFLFNIYTKIKYEDEIFKNTTTVERNTRKLEYI